MRVMINNYEMRENFCAQKNILGKIRVTPLSSKGVILAADNPSILFLIECMSCYPSFIGPKELILFLISHRL